MKYEDHLELAFQELEARQVPNVAYSPLPLVRAKDPVVRQQMIERRKVQRRARKWIPNRCLRLMWRGKAVRPPQYNSLGENVQLYLTTAWRDFLDPIVIGYLGLICIVDLDSFWVTAFRMSAILFAVMLLAAAITPFYYAWIRKKYALSTWEELIQVDANQPPSAGDCDQNPAPMRGSAVLE